ncbi:MAG: hypothetical protein KGN77_05225 [Xanthomonadaceae bacterium]|nr:hypothetical protein [Xanthomonadaceae bacterium]
MSLGIIGGQSQPQTAAQILARLTGASTLAAGALLFGAGTSSLSTLTIGTTGQHLGVVSGNPAWTDTFASAKTFSAGLTVSGGTITVPTGSITATSGGNLTWSAATAFTGGGTLALGGFTLTVPATGTAALLATANAFNAAQSITAANSLTVLAAATQDAIQLSPRAGGTGSYITSITTGVLTGSYTMTIPATNTNDTFAMLGTAQTFSAANTFSAGAASTSTTTGTVIVSGSGGVGIGGALNVGGSAAIGGSLTVDLGSGALPSTGGFNLKVANIDGATPVITGESFGAYGLTFNGYTASGTRSAKTALSAGSGMVQIVAAAWDGSGYVVPGYSEMVVNGTISGTNRGIKHRFYGVLQNATAYAEWFSLYGTSGTDPSGVLSIGGTYTAGNGLIQLPAGTTKAYGIAFDGTANLYRSAAGVITSDGALTLTGALTANNSISQSYTSAATTSTYTASFGTTFNGAFTTGSVAALYGTATYSGTTATAGLNLNAAQFLCSPSLSGAVAAVNYIGTYQSVGTPGGVNNYYANATLIGAYCDAKINCSATSGNAVASVVAVLGRAEAVGNNASGTLTVPEVAAFKSDLSQLICATGGATLAITSVYGLRLPAFTPYGSGTVTITNRYGISQEDANSTNIFAGASTFTKGVIVGTAAALVTSNVAMNNGAGVSAGTITNAPSVGNPTKWIPINDNGTTRYIPAW